MQAFAVLADNTRLHMVELLAERERSVGELVAQFRLSQPAISQHLKVLRDAGLVRVRPDAQRRLYSLDPGPLRALDTWLDRYRGFWTDRLDALEAHLAENRDMPADGAPGTSKRRTTRGRND